MTDSITGEGAVSTSSLRPHQFLGSNGIGDSLLRGELGCAALKMFWPWTLLRLMALLARVSMTGTVGYNAKPGTCDESGDMLWS